MSSLPHFSQREGSLNFSNRLLSDLMSLPRKVCITESRISRRAQQGGLHSLAKEPSLLRVDPQPRTPMFDSLAF